MVTGHAAIALLVKRARPELPAWLLVVAAYASDGVEFLLRQSGRVRDAQAIMDSHSLVADLVMAVILVLLWRLGRGAWKGAWILAAVVFSHWLADLITGTGKPTWPGGPTVGFDLYSHHLADFLLETALLVLTALVWSRARQRGRSALRPRASRWLVAVPLVLILGQLAFNVSGYYGVWDWKSALGSRLTALGSRFSASPPHGSCIERARFSPRASTCPRAAARRASSPSSA